MLFWFQYSLTNGSDDTSLAPEFHESWNLERKQMQHKIVRFTLIFRRVLKISKIYLLAVSCLSVYLFACLSVCPSVRPQGTAGLSLNRFPWNFIFECFFENLVEKIPFSFNSDLNNGYFDKYILMITSRSVLLRQICRWSQNTRSVFNKSFFERSCCLSHNVNKILYSRAGHIWQYDTRAFHAGYLRFRIHSKYVIRFDFAL
jgi:hypothetical protein